MAETYDVPLSGGDFNFRVRVYPAGDPNGSILVWLHGGGFMFGTLEMPEADQVGQRLSTRGTTVVSVDYTLAPLDALGSLPPAEPGDGLPTKEQMQAEFAAAGPRARYPVASLQTVAAFDWAVEHAAQWGAYADRVAPGGASAGGNLAAGAGVRLRDRGTTVPSLLALLYPVAHAPLPAASPALVAALADVPAALSFPDEATHAMNRNYLGDASPGERYAFPGGHDMSGLAATLIITADRDRLRASGEAFAAELALCGVDVAIVREHGALHGFLNEIGHPAGEDALELLANAVAASRRIDRSSDVS